MPALVNGDGTVNEAAVRAAVIVAADALVLSVYGQVQLATSTDYYFCSDNIALRATFRFGANIADTARIVKLTVAASGS